MTDDARSSSGWVRMVSTGPMSRASSPISTYTGRFAAVALVAALVTPLGDLGCSKEATPSAEQPKPSGSKPTGETPTAALPNDKSGTEPAADKPEEGSGAPADMGAAKPSYSETNFDLSIKAKGDYKAGKDAAAEIVLEAKAPFHANDKYPYKFKLEDSAGVTYAAKVVGKDKATVEHMKVTMPVAFSAEGGKKKITGVFHFSVCTEDKCMIEKRPLALEIDVK